MKAAHSGTSLFQLCRLFGVTRQAYYQHFWYYEESNFEADLVLQEVKNIRRLNPIIGCRKLNVMLQPFLLDHQIKMGRDALFDLMATHKLLVRKRKRKVQTTYSRHWLKKYPNLIIDVVPSRVNEVWVADITYFKIKSGNVYISFVTDAYSKKIVGYYVAETLEAINSIRALKMALTQNKISGEQLIHHSDRGVQYCCEDYVKLLQDNQIMISMTESGDPLDNAIAERVNGIIKEEYLNHYQFNNRKEVEKKLNEAVSQYNKYRPHLSCNMLTPSDVHQNNLPTLKLWKNYYKQKTNFVNVSQD